MVRSVADLIEEIAWHGFDVLIIFDDGQFEVTLKDKETGKDEGWDYSVDLVTVLERILRIAKTFERT